MNEAGTRIITMMVSFWDGFLVIKFSQSCYWLRDGTMVSHRTETPESPAVPWQIEAQFLRHESSFQEISF